tara:strand:- start:123 stop:512 length:390 start_codon:yes stop_codon:yes gene_type:complete
MNYQIVKLSNGEDIICSVENLESGKFKVTSPLKMSTHTKVTEKGAVESLGLSRWLQVYSDEPHYIIEKSGVVIMTPASEGLCRYYEYVLKSMDKLEMMKGPTQEELNEIENEEFDLDDWDIDEEDKIYH